MGYEKLSQKLTFYKAFFSPKWKFLIHTILQCLSAKTTAWNEFSSTMAFVIICLAKHQKFNFSKYIFESMVKNLDNAGKFVMYLRQGKDFSGRETPLFSTMVMHNQEEMGEDEAVNEEIDDSLVWAPTTATGLDVEQDRGNINKTQSKPTPNEPSSLGTSSGGGPRRQETMGDKIAQTGFENVSMKLQELMELCTNLQKKVLDLETSKTSQAKEITSLKRKVKRLEKKGGSRTHKLKRLYKVGLSARVESSDEASLDMFDVNDLAGEEVFVAEQGVPDSKKDNDAQVNTVVTTVSTISTILVSTTTITEDEITLAQALAELKSVKPKVKVTTATTTTTKGIVDPT
ncbi:hypothetical protein Tco_1331485 [Tanacetum coccineum]